MRAPGGVCHVFDYSSVSWPAPLRTNRAWGAACATYWDAHIHDLDITRHPVGSPGFFDDLDQYHFEKLHHLLRLVDFDGPRGRRVLDVGCGTGVDLVHFVARRRARHRRRRFRSGRSGSPRANFVAAGARRAPARRRRRGAAVRGRLVRLRVRARRRPVHRGRRRGWWQSAGACCSRADGRSSRSTTASPG